MSDNGGCLLLGWLVLLSMGHCAQGSYISSLEKSNSNLSKQVQTLQTDVATLKAQQVSPQLPKTQEKAKAEAEEIPTPAKMPPSKAKGPTSYIGSHILASTSQIMHLYMPCRGGRA